MTEPFFTISNIIYIVVKKDRLYCNLSLKLFLYLKKYKTTITLFVKVRSTYISTTFVIYA